MTARKQIKKQHRLARDQERRAVERSQTRRRLLGLGAAALAIIAVLSFAFAFSPWSGSGEAEENLPSIALAIGDNYFDPETLRVDAGQKYRLDIQNLGFNVHDVWMAGNDNKTDTGDDIRTDPLSPGDRATEKMQFDNPGTYYFVCTFHGGQGGTVIVQ
jgi:plastocyanin